MDRIPPRITAAASTLMRTAVASGWTPNELWSASATELLWTMEPIPNAAMAAKRAKAAPRIRPKRPPTPRDR